MNLAVALVAINAVDLVYANLLRLNACNRKQVIMFATAIMISLVSG